MTQGLKIIELLKKVPDTSLWGLAVQKVMSVEGAPLVMDLIIDLRSQAKDSPEIMRSILGAECFDLIMAI